jgi:hypothetical protein
MEFSLNDYLNQDVQIVFQSINRAGNNIYIDNFRIYEAGNEPVGFTAFAIPEIVLYPNPTKNKFVYEIKNTYFYQPQKMTISNAMGQVLYQTMVVENRTTIDLSTFLPGVYFITIEIEGVPYTQRIIKE